MSVLPHTLYPVVDTAAWVERLGRAGAKLIQLRAKTLAGDALKAEIERARDAAKAHGVTLVLNDFWALAIDCAVDFIHLGQEDLDTADLAAIRRAGIRVGVSTHSHEELDRALSVAPDYIALGPVWPTKLKQMPWAPQGLDRVTEWKRLIGAIPLVAIGGVTLERAPSCILAGADSVAAVSDFIANPDPEAQVLAWDAATGQALREREGKA